MGSRSKMLLVLAVAFSCCHGFDIDAVDERVIRAGLRCHETPGLAVSLVEDGRVVMSRGYGVTDLGTQTAVTNKTLFHIGSLTQTFTATLLLKLLEDKPDKSISTNVYKILGRGRFNNTLRSTYATLEDLLAHRLGIPGNNFIRLDEDLTREEFVNRIKYLKHVGGFRDSYNYNELMYAVVARVTEVLSGKTWEDSMSEHILQPLHMYSSTYMSKVDFDNPNMATPYVTEDKTVVEASTEFLQHWAKIGGGEGIVSNADDMANWMLFHLSGGRNLNGVQTVRQDSLRDMYRPRNTITATATDVNKFFRKPVTPVTNSNDGFALGWKTGYYRGLPIIQISGGTFGYTSLLTLIPDKNIGIFLAMTGSDPSYWFRITLNSYLADAMLGEMPWLDAHTICTFPAPWHETSPPRTVRKWKNKRTKREINGELIIYDGAFDNAAYGRVRVDSNQQDDSLKVTYGVGEWKLTKIGDHIFQGAWQGPPPLLDVNFRFKVDKGEAYAVIPSFEEKSPPIFYSIYKSF